MGTYPVDWCQSDCSSGCDRKPMNFATPLYALLVLPPITHSEAPPMIEFCGAPLMSSWYGRKFTEKSNLAFLRMLAWAPEDDVSIAHSPEKNLASASLRRPA